MPTYVFKGRNVRTNEATNGERFSANPQALAATLRREQIAPSSIREKRAEGITFSFGKKKVPQTDIAIFTRQFSVMLNAGLPLIQCLDAIGQQQQNATFKSVLETIRTDVEGGSTLSDAMMKHPTVFDSLFTNMIAAGETGGVLDTILQRLSSFIEKLIKLKKAVKSASMYPAIILCVALGVVGLVLWKVVPTFRTLFEGFNAELPLPTQIVIFASEFLENYVIFIFIGAGLGVYAFKNYYKTEPGRLTVDRALLKFPILGDILRKIGVARFTRTLATLLSSGVPILEGLEITARTSGNAVLEGVIRNMRKQIEEGRSMSEPMKTSNFFPPLVTQMVSVGESTGELDNMLVKVADYYEEEVDELVANLLTIMEPILMVFLGLIVGGIVISLYLPMFKLVQVMSGG